jgi:hypothetical protein
MTATERGTEKQGPGDDPRRDETEDERLDRNTTELVGEVRIAAVGIQVLFAFLLVVPFNKGWAQVTAFERDVYYVALLCIAAAAVMLITPTMQHRLLFRHHEKAYVVQVGSKLVIWAAGFLAVGLTAIMVLIANFLFGTAMAVIVGVGTALLTSTLWFVMPLRRRRAKR